MRFLACTVDVDPCPPANVTSITLSDVLDFSMLGITPSEVFYVYGWGFASVLSMFLIGLGVQYCYGLIRRL